LQETIIATSERIQPSVVHIEAIAKINDRRRQVMGSGLIVSADGLILTNQHVVEKAEKITVLVPGRKRRYAATVVGTDKQTDIAVVRIQPGEPLQAASLGTSEDVRVGQWVLAVGNPYGLEGTVSFGIVSAMGRNLQVEDLINDFIQTDAMIDHGSSGGPLVDLQGRVIGINSRGQGRGIGFTIPIDTALEVMRKIEAGGIERGWLGVTVQPLDRELAAYLGVPEITGVVVNSVGPDTPAARAGVEPGDILTALDQQTVEAEKEEDLRDFQRQVAKLAPGTEVELQIFRGTEARQLRARLGIQPKIEPAEAESPAGFHVQEITDNLFRSQRLVSRQGAYVSFVERSSPAAEAGLRPGDVIQRIEDIPIADLDGFRRAIEAVREKDRFLITAGRGDEVKFLLVKRLPGSEKEPTPPVADPGQASHSQD
jgi:serine protease Do